MLYNHNFVLSAVVHLPEELQEWFYDDTDATSVPACVSRCDLSELTSLRVHVQDENILPLQAARTYRRINWLNEGIRQDRLSVLQSRIEEQLQWLPEVIIDAVLDVVATGSVDYGTCWEKLKKASTGPVSKTDVWEFLHMLELLRDGDEDVLEAISL